MNTIIVNLYTDTYTRMCPVHLYTHSHTYEPLGSKLRREFTSAGFWHPGNITRHVPSVVYQIPAIAHRQDTPRTTWPCSMKKNHYAVSELPSLSAKPAGYRGIGIPDTTLKSDES